MNIDFKKDQFAKDLFGNNLKYQKNKDIKTQLAMTHYMI